MKVVETSIPEVLIIEPQVLGDDRGYFLETFRAAFFSERGIDIEFVQDNQSRSARGTLRGSTSSISFLRASWCG